MDARILQDHVDAINEILEAYLPEADGQTKELAGAVRYGVTAGGKRLRPMLMQECFHLFAGNREEPEILHAFMAAIEMVHTYSLIHDDLPAMDNDEYRRGKLTVHTKYGEAAGILTGDALLNLAFETVFQAIEESEEPEDYMGGISAGRILAEKAGMSGMIGGQYLDVYADKHPDFTVDADSLKYIYLNKTSRLLQSSMMIGAVFGGAADLEIAVIEKMAGYLGMAFQIQDDILDVEGNQEMLGKPVGSDEKNNKTTWVSLYGLDAAKNAVREYTGKALEIYDHLRQRSPFLRELLVMLTEREK